MYVLKEKFLQVDRLPKPEVAQSSKKTITPKAICIQPKIQEIPGQEANGTPISRNKISEF